MKDLDPQTRVGDALRESERRYRILFDHSPAALVVLDVEAMRFTDANDNACRLFKMSREQLLAVGPVELSPERLPDGSLASEHARRYIERSIAGEIPYFEWTHLDSEGNEVLCNIQLVRYPDQDRTIVQGCITDITQARKNEAELERHREHLEELVEQRTADLSAANRDLDSFCYSVSHDLRAPIRHIHSYAHILAETLGDDIPADARTCLENILGSAERMGVLIEELLKLSRLGRAALDQERVDMTVLARDVWREVASDSAGVEFEVAFEDLPEADADRSMIRQVLRNLLDNARKYAAQSTPPRIEITSLRSDGVDWYRVHDNGVGFDPEYADKIFDVFQRLHTAEDFPGTGVGLAIVKRIIERHGGQVRATSRPGEGSTFEFTVGPLPALPSPSA